MAFNINEEKEMIYDVILVGVVTFEVDVAAVELGLNHALETKAAIRPGKDRFTVVVESGTYKTGDTYITEQECYL